MSHQRRWLLALLFLICAPELAASDRPKVATFSIDVSPPIGSPLCLGGVQPAREIVDPLTLRGIVLLTDQAPIVLCAVDWVGIANDASDRFRDALAKAAGTSRDRVAVHCLHQHDAPGCDFATEQLLEEQGLPGQIFHVEFAEEVIRRAAAAVEDSVNSARPFTRIGTGQARVEGVASNRRILGSDGRVKHVRYTACRDPEVRAYPEGTIDPFVKVVSFWNEEQPILAISYYATHPQSYYDTGGVTCDFVGLARDELANDLPGTFCVHFNGAGGNIGAGKYNDGSTKNRALLAQRLAAGMKAAWKVTQQTPVTAADIAWKVVPVALPPSPRLMNEDLQAKLEDPKLPLGQRVRAARDLVWLRRCESGEHPIELSCLTIGPVRLVQMPGELFVEYQLAAQKMAPDAFVCVAAYGDYGPGYIGTEVSYFEGGYETGIPSRVSPTVERVLLQGLKDLLQ